MLLHAVSALVILSWLNADMLGHQLLHCVSTSARSETCCHRHTTNEPLKKCSKKPWEKSGY